MFGKPPKEVGMGKEPIIIIGVIIAILNVIQTSAITMSPALHAIIAAVTIGLGAWIGRSQVTPVVTTKGGNTNG